MFHNVLLMDTFVIIFEHLHVCFSTTCCFQHVFGG